MAQPVPKYPSQGQEALAARSESDREIADRLRELDGELATRRETVWRWRRGNGVPDARTRRVLAREFAIPVYSWDLKPGAAPAAAAPRKVAPIAGSAAPDAPPSPNAAEEAAEALRIGKLATIEQIDHELGEVRRRRSAPNLADTAAVRYQAQITALLSQRRQIERDAEILDDRILKENPAFRRWRAGVQALAKEYPDAARRLMEIVRQLDDEAAA